MRRPAPYLILVLLALTGCARSGSEGKAAFEEHPAEPVAAAAGLSIGEASPAGKGVVFVSTNYRQALQRARAENRLVMVDLYADWCGWCHKLDKDVFSDARVAAALGEVIPIKLDADREGQEIAEEFRVRGLPAILFLDGSGKLVKRIDGYVGPDQMIAIAGALPKA